MFAIKMYYVLTTDNIHVIGFGAVQPHTITTGFYRCQSSSNDSLCVVVIRHILRLCVEHLCWHNCANIQAWLRRVLRRIWLLIGLLSPWFAVVVWVTSLGAAFHWDKTFCFRQQDNLRQYWGWLLFETDCLPAEKKAKTEAFPFSVVKFAKYKQKEKKNNFHSNSRLADADTNCGGSNFMINWHRSK